MSTDSNFQGMRVFFHREPRLWSWILPQLLLSHVVKSFSFLIVLISVVMVSSNIIRVAGLVVLVALIGAYIWFGEYLSHTQSLSFSHWLHHNHHWKKRLMKLHRNGVKYVEAGTVVKAGYGDESIEVMWDCGYREYFQSGGGKWESIRVYDLGPAGYRSPIIVCDDCMEEVTGFSFQCKNNTCSIDLSQVYDLCHKHYNRDCHSKLDHEFQRIFAYGQKDRVCDALPLRKKSVKYSLLGFFQGSKVINCSCGEQREGTILKIVHNDGFPFERAKHWNCCAELEWSNGDTSFQSTGLNGKVEIKVVNPSDNEVTIYADHFPSLDTALISDFQQYKAQSSKKLENGESYRLMDLNMRKKIFKSFLLTNTNMTSIDVNDPCWEQCLNLHLIHFFRNELRVLPRKLMEHPLKVLSLSYNDFYDFPSVILSLKTIINLNMVKNHLTLLPNSLCNLNSLTNLHLGFNDIIYLPDCFMGLTNLVVLTLQNNQLSSLPPSFCKLSKLEVLYLNDNNFRTFPKELLDLSKLRDLKLHRNRIQSFSQEANQFCDRIADCTKHSNPSPSQKFVNPLRVLVIGESDSGKTSLIHALCTKEHVNPNAPKRDTRTVGIDNYHYFHTAKSDICYELSLWDFAGERSYAMMNGMFLANATMIWVVFSLRNFKCDKETYENKIGVWIRKVVSHFEDENDALPSIWIIGTHQELCTGLSNKKSYITECLFKSKSISNKNLGDELRRKSAVIFLSNTFKLNGHDELISSIEAIEHPKSTFVHEEWFSEEYRLNLEATEMIRNHQLPLMTLNQLRDFVNVTKKREFISHLHRSGEIFVITFHDLNGKKSTKVFLSAKWFIYILKQIFRHDLEQYISQLFSSESDRCDPEIIETVQKQLKKGEMSKDTLTLLWKALNLENCTDTLAQILCDYSLFYLDPRKKVYVIPWLIKDDGAVPKINFPPNPLSIGFKFTSDYIDERFFEEILIVCKHPNYERKVWNTVHSRAQKYDLFVACEKNLMKGYEKIMYDCISFNVVASGEKIASYPSFWQIVKNEVIGKVSELLDRHRQYRHKSFPSYIECPQCRLSYEEQPHLFMWNELKQATGDPMCTVCEEKHRNEHIPIAMLFPGRDMSDEFNLQNVLRALRDHLSDWYMLGLELGISKNSLDKIEKQFSFDSQDRLLTEMINAWLKTDSQASWDKLCISLRAISEDTLAFNIEHQYCSL